MERVKKSVAAHIIIGVVSAVVLTVSFVLLVNPLLTMLGTTSDTFEYASRYLTIIYLGIPATMLYNLTASLLRSVGDSKTPLYLLLFSSVMNVGLDLLFIIVFRWDVSGANNCNGNLSACVGSSLLRVHFFQGENAFAEQKQL